MRRAFGDQFAPLQVDIINKIPRPQSAATSPRLRAKFSNTPNDLSSTKAVIHHDDDDDTSSISKQLDDLEI